MKSPTLRSTEALIKRFKDNPRLAYIVLGVFGVFLFWHFGGSTKPHVPEALTTQPKVTGVQASVDPRDVWTDAIARQVDVLSSKMDEGFKAQEATHLAALNVLKKEMDALYSDNEKNDDLKTAEMTVKQEQSAEPKVVPQMAYLHQSFHRPERKDTEDYVTSGSFARAVLLTGVVAETGTESASTPQPILLRLVDVGIFSKGYKTQQIKEAILIGSCYGNLSSERAMCRLESISLKNQAGDIVERQIEGWLIGEDGRPGVKGDVIDKASNMARMAVLNGILGGMAGFFQNQATTGVYPISPLTGQAHALSGVDSLKAGGASGVGNALQKLAEYAIKRAEQMSPVIVVGSGRLIDVVFKKGFQLKDASPIDNKTPVTSMSGQTENAQALTESQISTKGNKRNTGYNQGVNSLNNLQMNQGT